MSRIRFGLLAVAASAVVAFALPLDAIAFGHGGGGGGGGAGHVFGGAGGSYYGYNGGAIRSFGPPMSRPPGVGMGPFRGASIRYRMPHSIAMTPRAMAGMPFRGNRSLGVTRRGSPSLSLRGGHSFADANRIRDTRGAATTAGLRYGTVRDGHFASAGLVHSNDSTWRNGASSGLRWAQRGDGWRHRPFFGWAGPVYWPRFYDDFFDYTFRDYGPYYDDPFWAYGYGDIYGAMFPRHRYDEPADLAPPHTTAGRPHIAQAPQQTTVGRPHTAEAPAQTAELRRHTAEVRPDTAETPPHTAVAPPHTAEPRRHTAEVRPDTAETPPHTAVAPPHTAEPRRHTAEVRPDAAETPPHTAVARPHTAETSPRTAEAREHTAEPPLRTAVAPTRTTEPPPRAAVAPNRAAEPSPRTAVAPPHTAEAPPRIAEARRNPPSQPGHASPYSAICGSDAQIANVPIDRIAAAVSPDVQQRAALDTLANASVQAAQTIKNACPTDMAYTAAGRLAAMERRVQAMVQAVAIIRSPIESFYEQLSEDQKERLNTIGPSQRASQEDLRSPLAACGPNAAAIPSWPQARIERAVRPNPDQRALLDKLRDANARAAEILRASCLAEPPATPPERVAAMAARLDALLQAVQLVHVALDNFYGGLDEGQKAQFNGIAPIVENEAKG